MKTLYIRFTFVIALIFAAASVASAVELRLSHQWSTKDIRHKVALFMAAELAKSDVGLSIKIFPEGSIYKATEQYWPLSRGDIDMTIFPLSYVSDRRPQYNLTLMPGLVKNHAHARRLSQSDFMKDIEKLLAEDDIRVAVHGYLSGGFAGTQKCVTNPEDVRGTKARSGAKPFDEMLAAAGASIKKMPSPELYNALQSGEIEVVNTSLPSFISFRIFEQVKCFTPPGEFSIWFTHLPILMNKSTYESLSDEQRAAFDAAAAKAEDLYFAESEKQDAASIEIFRNAGVEIAQMTKAEYEAWKAIAEASSYKNFAAEVEGGQALLNKALSVQ